MPHTFLDHLKHHGIEGPLTPVSEHRTATAGGPAEQGQKPAGGSTEQRAWDFAFATGIECSNPLVVNAQGHRLRRDLLTECGHIARFREDLALVKDLGIPCLRYGLPNHLIHKGPGRFDWSFADEA